MALPLLPPLEAGKTRVRTADLLGYADLDFYGVQTAPVATTDDMRGPNEEFRFLRDARTFLLEEHDASGVHDTLQIARVHLVVDWDGAAYTVDPESYAMGTTFRADAGAFTITAGAAGEITVDLAAGLALPNGTYLGCVDRGANDEPSPSDLYQYRTQLRSVTDSTTFLLRRWLVYPAGATYSVTLAHGPFSVDIFAGV